MADNVVMEQDQADNNDPHGYFSNGHRYQLLYGSPTRRLYLDYCVRCLGAAKCNTMFLDTQVNYTCNEKNVILETLNTLVLAPKKSLSRLQMEIERVKRKLFKESERRLRKSLKPNKLNIRRNRDFCRRMRRFGISMKVPRGYLNAARRIVEKEMAAKENTDIVMRLNESENRNSVIVCQTVTSQEPPRTVSAAIDQLQSYAHAQDQQCKRMAMYLKDLITLVSR